MPSSGVNGSTSTPFVVEKRALHELMMRGSSGSSSSTIRSTGSDSNAMKPCFCALPMIRPPVTRWPSRHSNHSHSGNGFWRYVKSLPSTIP
jgi:hypothetical protein